MSKDDPGFAICVAHVPFNQHLGRPIVGKKIMGRRDQSDVLRCPIKIERKSRYPEQVQGAASARIVGFWPVEVEDIARLTSQQPTQWKNTFVTFQKPHVRTAAYKSVS